MGVGPRRNRMTSSTTVVRPRPTKKTGSYSALNCTATVVDDVNLIESDKAPCARNEPNPCVRASFLEFLLLQVNQSDY